MPIPESDIRPEEAQFVARLLHEQVLAGKLDGTKPFLHEQLRFLDRFVAEQQGVFLSIPSARPISDVIDIPNSRGFFRVGFDNDEGNYGLEFVSGNWDNQSWCLTITSYHSVDLHRLYRVSIIHQYTEVLFRPPKKYDTVQAPKDLLPTLIEISHVEPGLTAK